jgi:hypothetical protein
MMPTLVKFRPENRYEREAVINDHWWNVVVDKGDRLCVKALHDVRWIYRNQVIDWKFVSLF